MFLQVIRRCHAGEQDIGEVYYNASRDVQLVYYNQFARSDAEYHQYDDVGVRGGAEAATSEKTEYHQYDDVAGRGKKPPVYRYRWKCCGVLQEYEEELKGQEEAGDLL